MVTWMETMVTTRNTTAIMTRMGTSTMMMTHQMTTNTLSATPTIPSTRWEATTLLALRRWVKRVTLSHCQPAVPAAQHQQQKQQKQIAAQKCRQSCQWQVAVEHH
jgi:hypothetical protein